MQRFFQWNHDIGLDVAAAFRWSLALAKPAKSRFTSTATKERLEEVAKACPAKLKFHTAIPAPVAMESTARLLRTPIRWRLKATGLIPVCAKLIVFLSLLRIA